ncbi:8-oxoguanine glycosylase ogg1, partial [Nowakowskiella sp. JEL0078]
VKLLCEKYGNLIDILDDIPFYSFPTIEALSKAAEVDLRNLGFGYRAKYIEKTAKMILENGGKDWLFSLRTLDYQSANNELKKLFYLLVGPKVADCICLMSLDKFDCVPVDTHIHQIAVRDFNFKSLKGKSITPKIYSSIANMFKEEFGEYAGWAQAFLFIADLSEYQDITEKDICENSTKKRTIIEDKHKSFLVKKLKEA